MGSNIVQSSSFYPSLKVYVNSTKVITKCIKKLKMLSSGLYNLFVLPYSLYLFNCCHNNQCTGFTLLIMYETTVCLLKWVSIIV